MSQHFIVRLQFKIANAVLTALRGVVELVDVRESND